MTLPTGPVSARLLFDTGSHRSFVTTSLSSRLGAKPLRSESLAVCTFGKSKTYQTTADVIELSLPLRDGILTVEAHVVPLISNPIERGPVSPDDWKVLKKYKRQLLADPPPRTTVASTIDILIGLDYYFEIIQGSHDRLPSGLTVLNSGLGFVLGGKATGMQPRSQAPVTTLFVSTLVNPVVPTMKVLPSSSVDVGRPNIADLWSLEAIGIDSSEAIAVSDDDVAQQYFDRTVVHRNGRYQVRWPWKAFPPDLPNNFALALGRLRTLGRRLDKDPQLFSRYDDIIQQQLQNGIIEAVQDQPSVDTVVHYLPHQPVLTPGKTTTKLRIVYDASSKSRRHDNCINECLHRGPVRLPSLCGVLLRFRLHRVAFIADVEKAFLQIDIHPADRDATRFLWFRDGKTLSTARNNFATYRFCRVPFGLICSPFLLEATIRHHLTSLGNPTAALLRDNIYVDNLVLGAESESAALAIFQEARSAFSSASMNLREWMSNSSTFVSTLPSTVVSDNSQPTVLGIRWWAQDDVLTLQKVTLTVPESLTKRAAVQQLSKVYDPLGWFHPVSVAGKLFLQRLWCLPASEWDTPLPDTYLRECATILSELQSLSRIKLPRLVSATAADTVPAYDLHVFCDASQHCYATAVYLRVATSNSVSSHLIFSKVRLSPKKVRLKDTRLTIPRLELLAVLIGVRAAIFVRTELQVSLRQPIVVWTDSSCTLHWIASAKPLSVFVGNRVKEIRAADDLTFRHVPSEDNPADLPTRGCSVLQLEANSLWWNGPHWLADSPSTWPSLQPEVTPAVLDIVTLEQKPVPRSVRPAEGSHEVQCIVATEPVQSVLLRLMKAKSNLQRVLRAVSRCLSFLSIMVWSRLSKKTKHDFRLNHELLGSTLEHISQTVSPNARDIRMSLLVLVRFAQQEMFVDVLQALQNNKRHSLCIRLGVKLDHDGILRCYGRYENAQLSKEAITPILLPRSCRVTFLIIMDIHERLLHCGVSHTLSILRSRYWVPQGRAAVRRVLSQCVTCKRHEGPAFQQPPMAPLPAGRLGKSFPFQFTGLDNLGPLKVKDSSGTIVKIWLCLFTCFTTRAVHLECMLSMSTVEFLHCFRRFVSRRGHPQHLYSDNAAHFKLASDTIESQWARVLHDPEVASLSSQQNINWKFTTQYAPWEGGLYERMVGLVKRCIRKAIGRMLLTVGEMITLSSEVEAVLNSRPLTYIGSDECNFVTPSHFLNVNRSVGLSTPAQDDANDVEYRPSESSADAVSKRFKRLESTLNQFWSVWRKEYLLSLRERSGVHRKSAKSVKSVPAVGDVVVIGDESLSRCLWKLGVVVKANESADGCVRSADIRMQSGRVLTRPVSMIYPLELRDSCDTCNDQSLKLDCNGKDSASPASDSENLKPRRAVRRAAADANARLAAIRAVESSDSE